MEKIRRIDFETRVPDSALEHADVLIRETARAIRGRLTDPVVLRLKLGLLFRTAVSRGYADLVSELGRSHPWLVYSMGHGGMTPLILAASAGRQACVRELLKLDCGIDETDSTGSTALMHAVRKGDVDTIRILMRHGADPRITDLRGTNALELARKTGLTSCAEEMERWILRKAIAEQSAAVSPRPGARGGREPQHAGAGQAIRFPGTRSSTARSGSPQPGSRP